MSIDSTGVIAGIGSSLLNPNVPDPIAVCEPQRESDGNCLKLKVVQFLRGLLCGTGDIFVSMGQAQLSIQGPGSRHTGSSRLRADARETAADFSHPSS